MQFEVFQIGSIIANNPLSLAVCILSRETSLAWQLVVLRQITSDQFISELPSFSRKNEFENYIRELNKPEEKYYLLKETVLSFGDEEEIINLYVDSLLTDWRYFCPAFNQNCDEQPEILVTNSKADNKPVVHKITSIQFDGQEMHIINVTSQTNNVTDPFLLCNSSVDSRKG